MPPSWLIALSWAATAGACASAAWIAFDIYGRGYRQRMTIMEAVWPLTALYFGPVAVAAYRAWGRPATARWQREHGDPPGKPGYAITATGVSHCGAGCTLGDIIAEFAVFGLGASVAGLSLAHPRRNQGGHVNPARWAPRADRKPGSSIIELSASDISTRNGAPSCRVRAIREMTACAPG